MSRTLRRPILLIAAGALLLAALTVYLATGAGRAHACSCAAPPPPLEALEAAAAVFSGTVVSFETYEFEVDFGSGRSESFWSVEFEVDAAWKGPVASTTYVYVWHGPACGYGHFEVGADFLVYGDERDFPGVDADTLFVGACSRTRPLERAEDDLEALGDGQSPEPGIAGADPASDASDEPPRGPTLAETGHGPAFADGERIAGHGPAFEDAERIAGSGPSDVATTPYESNGPPGWAIPLLAGLVTASVLIRLAVRPRLRE